MTTRFPLILGLLLAFVASSGAQVADVKDGPIRARDFPKVAGLVFAFEERVNAVRVEDRASVLYAIEHAWLLPDAEVARFFQRVARQETDAYLRGYAIKALYGMGVPIDPAALPTTFTGYHRDQVIDRQKPDMAAKLIAEVKRGDLPGGYAAYGVGLLRIKEAASALRDLAESKNVFVRYSAGRALAEVGDMVGAAAILKTILTHEVPKDSVISKIEDPYYLALAARAYADLGPVERKAGIERLVGLIGELEVWQDINAQGRLESARRMLGQLSGRYFLSHKDAVAWARQQNP